MAPYSYSFLLNLRSKANRYSNHLEFLKKCQTLNVIPKGLKLKFGYEALPNSNEFRDDVERLNTDLATLRVCGFLYQGMLVYDKVSIEFVSKTYTNTLSKLVF